jgi:2-succinyl-5-enolpyruvyl-6-hydroxy-3-cyclohexene-1-carboxylate synthase
MLLSDEKHVEILLGLLKEYSVRKVVVSPGATNIPVVVGMASDDFFELFSAVDERSAAYMAVGLSEASGEIVALSCTGATASRNYMPGLTEAFYRGLPIVALTSFNGQDKVGNLFPQAIDRSVLPNDVVKMSVALPVVKDDSDKAYCNLLVNKALNECLKPASGPVHINITTTYSRTYKEKKPAGYRVVKRVNSIDTLPSLYGKRVAVFIGSHRPFDEITVAMIERFCEANQAAVFVDHTSNYYGKYKVNPSLVCSNCSTVGSPWKYLKPDVAIYFGGISADYPSVRILSEADEVWRVSTDGEIRDRAGNLTYVVQQKPKDFFEAMSGEPLARNEYFDVWSDFSSFMLSQIPSLPFSGTSIARSLSKNVKSGMYLHLAILNTIRNWNFFPVQNDVFVSANVGGFGIDGSLSTTLGALLAFPEKIHLCVIGDLAFFYDMNALGNRDVNHNLRIVLINNGRGAEFTNYSHLGAGFGEVSDKYISAAGHFGANGIKASGASGAHAWASSMGFDYVPCMNELEVNASMEHFLDDKAKNPILMECFVSSCDESAALEIIRNVNPDFKERALRKISNHVSPLIKLIRR